MHVLTAIVLPAPYVTFGITYALWSFIAVGFLAPVRLFNAMYRSAKLSGKYHFRRRYHVEKQRYRNEIFLHSLVLMVTVIVARIVFIK